MESGIYLSPGGLNIVEIVAIAINKFCQSYDVNFGDTCMACDGNMNQHLSILFAEWEYLGAL